MSTKKKSAKKRKHKSVSLAKHKPVLPTYHAVANYLEKKNGSGKKLVGWTVLRMLLIAPPFRAVGVPWKQSFEGAALASGLISLFTLL